MESYPTKEELVEALDARQFAEVVSELILSGVPFAFRNAPGNYQRLLAHLAGRLSVAETDLVLVGSGRVGFSLNPDPNRFGQPFSARSDLDVAVVSQDLFDRAWIDLLRLTDPQLWSRGERIRRSVREHRDLHYIHDGRMKPHLLMSITDVADLWFDAFRSDPGLEGLAGRELNGMLFRTWAHAEIYYSKGLRQAMWRVQAASLRPQGV
jgi:hypothetical protein